jgi:hypothetical protein
MAELDRVSARRLGRLKAETVAGRARLRSDSVGALTHEAIAVALTSGDDVRDAAGAARAVVPSHIAPVYRLALLHRVTTATAVYLRDLPRDPAEWKLLGSEMIVDGVCLDLLFADSRGRIEADEIKTGLLGPAAQLPWVLAQVDAQLQAGQNIFGSAFVAVRLVDLARRQATRFAVSGDRTAA